jgi:putative DNA primase/helicase
MTDEIPTNHEVGMWRFKQIAGDTFYIFGMENGQWVFRKEALPELPPPPPPPPLLPEAFTGTPDDLPPAQEEGGHFTDDWFRFMGYEKSESGTQSFYFFVFRSNQLIRLSPTAMNKSNLMLLAPLNWWEQMFPSKGKSKVDTDAAANYLIEQSIEQGIFNPDNIRGRGAWIDGKNTVIHCGSHLIVNGEHLPFNKFKSKYIYEAGYDLGFQFVEPMNATEGKKLLDLCSLMNWDRPINAYFLAGWCVIAPVCGALKWRPHIWITGAAGTGKSWIFEKIVRRLLSGTALSVQSETTEAGIRQYLGQDALPVTFDEAEGEDRKAQDRMQSVLTLMRGASTSDGGMIIKGSAGGSATRYCIRSCFAYASIGVSLNQQSDRSRVTVLSVSKLQGEEGKKRWEQIQRAYHETMTEDYTTRLQSRTVALLPTIIKNAETFASAAAVELGDQRAGDQVGALLAGAYSLISNKQITFDEALAWIKTKDWSDERAHDDNRDEVRLITHLMERVAEGENMEGKRFRRTVGELVSIARGVVDWADMLPEVATKNLLTLGYRLDMNKGTLLVSNTAEFIRSSLKDTPWVNNHLTILRRLKGAQPKDQTTFGSYMKSRAIEIPLVTIFGE